jgi:small subunit ribosomal protein S16
MTRPATIDVDRMKAYEWLKNGAQPTDTVRAILRFKGVMYYKHLQRGVLKGAMTPEDAEMKFRDWVDTKEAAIAARVKATADERKTRATEISGTKKKFEKKKVEQAPVDELLNVNLAEAAAKETANDAVIETPVEAVKETPAEVVTETPAEVVVAETPAEVVAETPAEVVTETPAETPSEPVADATEEFVKDSEGGE